MKQTIIFLLALTTSLNIFADNTTYHSYNCGDYISTQDSNGHHYSTTTDEWGLVTTTDEYGNKLTSICDSNGDCFSIYAYKDHIITTDEYGNSVTYSFK